MVTSLGHYKSVGSLPDMGLASPFIVRYDDFMVNSPVDGVSNLPFSLACNGHFYNGWVAVVSTSGLRPDSPVLCCSIQVTK